MPRILVVDDEPGMRQVISKILIPLGYEIIGTDEGARSIQIMKEQNPDAVLLDIRLADMDTPDIIAGLKKIKPGVPVIILSGFGDVEAAAELVKQGAFDYISKPFKVNDFTNLIGKALAKPEQEKSSVKAPPPAEPAVPGQNEAAAPYSELNEPKNRTPLVIAAVVVAVVAAGILAWETFLDIPNDAEFRIPCANPSGICFDRNNLWISDWAEECIYKNSLGSHLKTVKAFKTQDIAPTGIAFDGKNIWTTSSLEQKINKHSLDASLSIEASYKSPGPSPAGLCFDGKNIWSADFQQGKIYRHKAGDSFEAEASFDIPAQNPCGLFITGGFAYVADAKTNRIYKLSTDTFFLAGIYEIPGFEGQDRHLASIGFDGRSVWACAGRIDRIFRYRMSSLKRVEF